MADSDVRHSTTPATQTTKTGQRRGESLTAFVWRTTASDGQNGITPADSGALEAMAVTADRRTIALLLNQVSVLRDMVADREMTISVLGTQLRDLTRRLEKFERAERRKVQAQIDLENDATDERFPGWRTQGA